MERERKREREREREREERERERESVYCNTIAAPSTASYYKSSQG